MRLDGVRSPIFDTATGMISYLAEPVQPRTRDAMTGGGRLTIETANTYFDEAYNQQNPEVERGRFALIAISDHGVGMPPDIVQRAFDPFFTTKPPGKGTGLGPSQVYGFLKQSRGHVKSLRTRVGHDRGSCTCPPDRGLQSG